jgi:hypothetical protein
VPWQAQPVQPSGRVDATLRSIRSALPAGRLLVSARQDRNHGELLPSWTVQISGPLAGGEFSIELAGPILGQLLEDAIEALVTLGIDVPDELDERSGTYTPVDASDPDSYPA